MRTSALPVFLAAVGVVFGQQRPPVILIDGYHLLCKSENLTAVHDFGDLEQRLLGKGVSVSFFGTCSFNGRPSIEDMANSLGATSQTMLLAWAMKKYQNDLTAGFSQVNPKFLPAYHYRKAYLSAMIYPHYYGL